MYGIGNISATLNDVLKPFDGLGKPTIKLEFEDNAALADFLTSNKQSKQYAPYTDVTATETPTAANAKAKSKIRNGILMPADDSTTPEPPTASALPPTKTPPPLPPAPTAKALPPHIWTPLERQIKEIKKKYPDALLLFRVGDFFEAWGGDAITISIALNLPITKRLGTSMIGIPYNALDKYLPKLVKQGYKVAICEQLEDANATNKIITKNGVLPVQASTETLDSYYKHLNNENFFGAIDDLESIIANKDFFSQYVSSFGLAKLLNSLYNSIIKYKEKYGHVLDTDEYIANVITALQSKCNITEDRFIRLKDDAIQYYKQIPVAKSTKNEPPVVKFTPKKPKQKEPEIEFDNVTYITRGMPAIIMDVPQSSISSKTYLNDWWNFAERKYHYPDDIVTFVQIEDKDNGTHYSKYYQFFFKNRDKDFVLRNIRNKKNIIFKDDFFIVTKLADIEQIENALLDDGNRHLVIIKPLIYDDGLDEPQPEPTTPEVEPQPKKETIVDRSSEREHVLKQAQDIIYTDNVETTYLAPDIPVKTFYLDDLLNVSAIVPFFKHKYGNDVLVGNIGGTKKKPIITFVFDDAVKVGKLLKQRVRGNNAYIVIDKNILPSIRKIKDVYDLILYEDHVKGLGKPTIKLEFEDNADLMSLFDTDGISGLTVNDKPADIFNCPESALQTQGYKPTYRRLPDYSHLIDTADGRKTLKGYGFDRATLDELINACKHYPQVARLADHLKDPAGDPLQSAFNVWHWLHTNIRYAYDTPGEEEIRTPARVWADRESGVDCDCLAVMTACLLLNMGLNPKFEIVAFNNEPTFSHIYVNLDGAAIDRVLPVFLARPDHITKTQIMDIPVYQLSGIGGCDALSGVYSSTLAKLQQGTATGEDINDFRKTQVLVTLRGIDDAAYSLAALLMPHVVTIADDGTYYFDSTAMAQLATKLDHDLADLISSNADADTISQWIAAAAKQIDGAASVTSNGGDDTIVVIINPKGATTRVIGQMVKSQTDTLTPLTQTATATDTAAQTYAQSATPAIMQTSAMPGVSPDGDTADEDSDSNTWLWIAGISAALGIGAAVMGDKKKKKRR